MSTEGWALQTSSARRFHAFDSQGRSFCRGYGLHLMTEEMKAALEDNPLDSAPSRDDCTACRRAVDKRLQEAP